MLEPVGPLPSKVYWVRRSAVVAAAVAVVALLIWIFTRGSGSDTSASTAPTTLAASAATAAASTVPSLTGELAAGTVTSATEVTSAESVTASAAESVSAAATAEAVPSLPVDTAAAQAEAEAAAAAASAAAQAEAEAAAAAAAAAEAARPRDDQGRLICTDDMMTLTATVGAPTYNVGQQPIVGVTVVNSSAEPCVRDLSGGLQDFTATDAAGTRVWATSDCVPGTGTDVRLLQPGESVQYNIRWSGLSSSPGCATERTRVPAGEYSIVVNVGTAVSAPATLTFV